MKGHTIKFFKSRKRKAYVPSIKPNKCIRPIQLNIQLWHLLVLLTGIYLIFS